MVKMKWIAQGFMGVFLLLAGTHAYAATYYFSTSGNNTTGTGTQSAPFYSLCGPWAGSGCATGENKLSRGFIAVNPGDTFLFKRGDEWVGLDAVWTLNATGAQGNPLTFGAWGDPNLPRPIFRGAKTAFELGKDSWTNVSGTPIWYTTGINVWPNMAAQEETAPGGPSLYGAWSVQGVDNTNGWTSNQSMVRGTYFYDSTTQRLYVWRSDGLKPDHAAGRDIYIGVAPNDGTDRFVKVNRGNAAGSTDPKFVGGHYVFQDLHVKMSRGYGFATSYPNTQYLNCLSELNSMEGFLFDRRRFGAPLPGSKDGVMRNSVSRRNNLKQGTGTGQGITIESENVWIYDSESYENAWAGVDFLDYASGTKTDGGGIVNSRVYHNGIQPVSQHNYDPNIYIDGGSNITIQNCKIWGAGVDPRGVKTRNKPNPGISIDVEGNGFSAGRRPTNIKVVNTLSYGNMGPAIQIGSINGSQSAVDALSNIQLVGNTLSRDRGDNDIKGYYDPTVFDVGIRPVKFSNISSGLVFKNNIVVALNTVRAPVFGDISMFNLGKTAMDFDNNMYYCPSCNFNVNGGSSSGGFFSYNYISNLTIDQFRNLGASFNLQQDTVLSKAIMTANPLLTNASFVDFDGHLISNSPAIDVANTAAFPVMKISFSGTTRADGAADNPYNDLGYHYPLTGAAPPPPPPSADTQAPSAPVSLSAVQNLGQITLSWVAATDNVAVTGYQVFDGTNLLGKTASPGYTLTNIVPGKTYGFLVRAFDAANNTSSPSNTVTLTAGATSDTTPPTTPAGLIATVSNTQVTLSWTASTDNRSVAGYEIMNNGQLLGTSVSTSFVHNGTAGTTYNYTVRAGDASSNMSASSAIVTVTIPSQAEGLPTAPSNLVGNYVNGQVQLSWIPATNPNGYNVYRNNNYYKTVGASSTSTYDSKVTAGQTYIYKVQAYDASDNRSAFTNEVSFTIPGGIVDTTAPNAPANLTALISGTAANLTWSASTDNVAVTAYQVFQGTTLKGTVTATSYTDLNLVAGQSYSYIVKALDGAGNISAASNTASVSVPGLSAPTNLIAMMSGPSVYVAWTSSAGAVSYRLFRDGELFRSTASVSITDAAVTQGQTYAYSVQCVDSANNYSAFSNSMSVSIPDTMPPTAPSSLTASLSGTQVTLSWAAASDNVGVSGYDIFNSGVALGTSVSTSFVHSVATGSTYSYTVRSKDAAGNKSASSGIVTMIVPAQSINSTAPTDLVAVVSSTGTSVKLSWGASSVGMGYNVFRNDLYLKTVGTLSATDSSVPVSGTYRYKVQAYDASGTGLAFSNEVSVVVAAASSAPVVPADFSVTSSSSGKVSMKWNASVGAVGYDVFRNGVYLKTVSSLSASDSPGAGTWFYKLQAYNNYGRSAFTKEMTVKISH